MVYIRTWLLFIRCIFSYLISPSSNKPVALAGRKLLSLSFRYSDADKHSKVFFIKSFLKAIVVKKISVESAYKVYTPGGLFFYDDAISEKGEKMRMAHIEYFLHKPVSGSIWKNRLLGYYSFADKLAQCFFETLLFIMLLPVAFFAQYAGSVGLIFREYVETVNLIKILKKNKVQTLYFYSIYQKDSNVASLAIKQMLGIEVIKVTSLTPLKFWNSIIVGADKLILCDANQYDELETYKDTIQVKDIEVWGPENVAEVAPHYSSGNIYDINKNVLGFYSTASYLRAMEGDIEQNGMKKNEDTVKSYLAEYLKANPAVSLIVFPHPREKRGGNKEAMIKHYNDFFNGLNYVVYDSELPSAYCFEKVDLGIAMYSSVIYERLYFGFKSLMMPFGSKGMDVPGKAIANMCATDKADFFMKIDKYKEMTVKEYFNSTGLQKSAVVKKLVG